MKRAFTEFLAMPSAVIVVFLLLALGLYALERASPGWLLPLRQLLQRHVFLESQATADLLSTVAAGLITVATVTITLLLVALQQNAASLSTEVLDQFLRRRTNQFYFGFFVGLSLFALITLATVNESHNPAIAASVAFLLTVVALYLLIVLLYTAIDQMRPVNIIETVHTSTLKAREKQRNLLERTRRESRFAVGTRVVARAPRHGYVVRVDLDVLESEIAALGSELEVELSVSIGAFVSTGDVLAHVGAGRPEDAASLADAVVRAVRLERQRDYASDPGDGIEEMGTIAWTSISTSKSNPAPGLIAIRSLRDLLARWSDAEREGGESPARGGRDDATAPLPVVYRDNVPEQLIDELESLAVVSSESMQHQSLAEVLRAFAVLFDRLPAARRPRVEDAIRRILASVGDHVLTAELDRALSSLVRSLDAAGREHVAAAVEEARARLARTVGRLHSRSTRAGGRD